MLGGLGTSPRTPAREVGPAFDGRRLLKVPMLDTVQHVYKKRGEGNK